MKTTMKQMTLALGLMISAATANAAIFPQAAPVAPLWACDLDADLSGSEQGLIISTQVLKGEGELSCVTLDGRLEKHIPVNVQIRGTGVGLGFARINDVRIITVGLGVAQNPEALASRYSMGLSAGASLIRAGVQADIAFVANRKFNRGSFEVGLMGKDVSGLAAGLHATTMKITLK